MRRSGHAMPIVTFDFHNTLVACDRWFELEVRTLPWEVILGLDLPEAARPGREAVLSAYKELRAEIVRSGNEINSYASVHHILDTLGLAAGEGQVRSLVDRLMESALEDADLVSGAETLVRSMHQRGFRLAVISSAIHHDFLEAALDRFKIGKCFEQIVTSASSGYYKSNPEIYRSTIATLGGHLPECVHIGDSLRWDVDSARRVGMKTIWLDRGDGAKPWEDAPPPVPDLRVESFVGTSQVILDFVESVGSGRGAMNIDHG